MEYNQDKWGKTSIDVKKKKKYYIGMAINCPIWFVVLCIIMPWESILDIETGSEILRNIRGFFTFFYCSSFLYACYMIFKGINIYNYLEEEEKKKKEEDKRKKKEEKEEEKRKKKEEKEEEKKKKKEEKEEEKKKLIEKYGKKDGMLIFTGKISEKRYLNKIAKEKEKEKRKKELIEKHGEKFGEAVFIHKIVDGMSKVMVSESIGKPNYKDSEKWYYGEPFKKYILFEKNKVIQRSTLSEGIWLDMPKDMLIASYGKPEDEKKEVSKNGTKLRWYYGGRETRQGTTAYNTEVRLENDIVVGWKELE